VGRALFPDYIEFATTFTSLFIRRERDPSERTLALKQFTTTSRTIFAAHFDLCRYLLSVLLLISITSHSIILSFTHFFLSLFILSLSLSTSHPSHTF
jgi:hypothetical protein